MLEDNDVRKRGTADERERILEAIPFHEEKAIPAVEIAHRTGLPTRKVGGIIKWNLTGVTRKKDGKGPWLYWRMGHELRSDQL